MNYEQMVLETDRLIRRTMLHNDIAAGLLTLLAVSLMIAVGVMLFKEHRLKARARKAELALMERQNEEHGGYYQDKAV